MDGMQKIEWYCSVGLVGCRITGSFEMEVEATDTEIDEAIRDAVMERIEWGRTDG